MKRLHALEQQQATEATLINGDTELGYHHMLSFLV
jgi:hypothetical protein